MSSYGIHLGGGTEAPRSRLQDPVLRRRLVFLLLGLCALTGWLYLIFFSDLLTIHAIEVRGVRRADPVEVTQDVFKVIDERVVWRPWPARHEWFIDRAAIAQRLKNDFFFDHVVVDKINSGVLRLNVTEQENRIIFRSRNNFVWLDAHGLVTGVLSPIEMREAQNRLTGKHSGLAQVIPMIHVDLDIPLVRGMRCVPADTARRWLVNNAQAIRMGFSYREINLGQTSSTQAIYMTHNDERVLIDIMQPIEPQIAGYLGYKQTLKPDQGGYKTIDARVAGKLFVK